MRSYVLLGCALVGLAACIPIPPRQVELAEVPAVSGPTCKVTIVRKNQFAGGFPTHYVSLDGVAIASLRPGQYTTFPVAEGHHVVGVTWRVGDRMEGFGGPGGGVAWVLWNPYSRYVDADCAAPAERLLTITAHGFPRTLQELSDESLRVEITPVDALTDEFLPERNTYVPAGRRKER